MSDESEKRFHSVMNRLFHAPHSPSSERDLTGKKRPNPSLALALVAPKSTLNLAASSASEASICRPWDRGDLMRRSATFKSMTWFAKPEPLSALNCARRGWINTDIDVISCEACGAQIIFSTPSSWNREQVEKAASVFSVNLEKGHKSLCPWTDNVCDEMLSQFPPMPPVALVDKFKERQSLLSQLLSLPEVSSSAVEHVKCPQFEQVFDKASTDPARIEYLDIDRDLDSEKKYYQREFVLEPQLLVLSDRECDDAASFFFHPNLDSHLLVDCHWWETLLFSSGPAFSQSHTPIKKRRKLNKLHHHTPHQIKMTRKLRYWLTPQSVCWLLLPPLFDVGYKPPTLTALTLISLCGWEARVLPYIVDIGQTIIMTESQNSDANKQKTSMNEELPEQIRVRSDPNSTVLDCMLCGANVGLWAFSTVPQPVEFIRLIGYSEADDSRSETTRDNASSSKEKRPDFNMTIAGGPPPAKQNFKAAISLPVVAQNVRARFSCDSDFSGCVVLNQSEVAVSTSGDDPSGTNESRVLSSEVESRVIMTQDNDDDQCVSRITEKDLKRKSADEATQFDPIRQHRHFCPWIASTGSEAPGWKQTLLALHRQRGFSPLSHNSPSASIIQVDDPLSSVRKLFMSPSPKRTKRDLSVNQK